MVTRFWSDFRWMACFFHSLEQQIRFLLLRLRLLASIYACILWANAAVPENSQAKEIPEWPSRSISWA